MIILRAMRLNEAAGRSGTESTRHQSMAVTDLEWAATVIPIRDKTERDSLYPMNGAAKPQTYQGGQAQIKAAISACKAYRVFYLRGIVNVRIDAGQELRRPKIKISDA
jgi:hypothetical protein